MLIRTALALLLLLPASTSAQNLDTAVSAVVRISGISGDASVRGSGFVVGLDHNKATIVTASHVIQGVQRIEVTFAADATQSFPAGTVLGMDANSPNGLAVFQVQGAIPTGVTTLSFEDERRPHPGETLFLMGFPQMEHTPRTTQRALSSQNGTLLLIDQASGEGFSGGPVLQDGKVMAVVTSTDDQTTYAVSAVVARFALEGWGVKLGVRSSPPVPPPHQVQATCVPGEETTENGITYLRICGGTFIMGSTATASLVDGTEKPVHSVTLSEFWLSKTEITNQLYRRAYPDHQGEASLPVANVSWTEAEKACESFGAQLPTEAEWEYAARAGTQTLWSFGDEVTNLGEYAWYKENSGDRAHVVGTKKPNPWGLYDMHGNMAEWVADWYGTYPGEAQTNPSGPPSGRLRVLRGGSFADNWPNVLRSAIRGKLPPEVRTRNIGFRCVRGSRRQP